VARCAGVVHATAAITAQSRAKQSFERGFTSQFCAIQFIREQGSRGSYSSMTGFGGGPSSRDQVQPGINHKPWNPVRAQL
jgi:hypothetical protein